MKKIGFITLLLSAMAFMSACQKDYRCSMFNNDDTSFKMGTLNVDIDYVHHLAIKAKVSLSSDQTITEPVYIAVDGQIVDSTEVLPWEKEYKIKYLALGKHYFTFSYANNSYESKFWVCSRDFNWDVGGQDME